MCDVMSSLWRNDQIAGYLSRSCPTMQCTRLEMDSLTHGWKNLDQSVFLHMLYLILFYTSPLNHLWFVLFTPGPDRQVFHAAVTVRADQIVSRNVM